MICRFWRGWTAAADADAFEQVARTRVLPAIERLALEGFCGIELLRREPVDGQVEFAALSWFDPARGDLTRDPFEPSVMTASERELLSSWDDRATEFRVVDDSLRLGDAEPGGAIGPLPRNAALVVIDVQQGFDDGSWGSRNNPTAERNIRHLLAAWRSLGMPIHHVHHASTSPKGSFRPGTKGHEVKPEAKPQSGEMVHVKTVNSGFIGTQLEKSLRKQGVDTLVITGLTTNHCVSTTTRMAGNLGFDTYLVADATATFASKGVDGRMRPAAEVHLGALSDLSREFATITTTEKVFDALPAAGARG